MIKLVIAEVEVEPLVSLFKDHGCRVIHQKTEYQHAEQLEERTLLLNIQDSQEFWPTTGCGECSWFDPVAGMRGEHTLEAYCGFKGWASEQVATLRKTAKAQDDLFKCPLHGDPDEKTDPNES